MTRILERGTKRNAGRNYFGAEKLLPGHLYGENIRSRQAPGFILSDRKYSPWFKTPKHSHEHALFCFVVQGAYTETFGVNTRICESQILLFHPADEVHTEHFHDAGAHLFIIEFEPNWLERLREQTVVIDHSAGFHGGDIALLGMKLYKEFLQPEEEISQLVLEGLVLAIVGEVSRHRVGPLRPRPPRWLAQARELLHDRFAEPLTLAHIAQTVGIHPVHLAQMFHKHYHCTVGLYLRRLRLEFARQELSTSHTPLCQIALAAGFSDQSHFTRTFKRYLGVTPAEYRELLAEPRSGRGMNGASDTQDPFKDL